MTNIARNPRRYYDTVRTTTTTAESSNMQRLRTTFTRSRTPTGADMKTQSSLEVPKQVKSREPRAHDQDVNIRTVYRSQRDATKHSIYMRTSDTQQHTSEYTSDRSIHHQHDYVMECVCFYVRAFGVRYARGSQRDTPPPQPPSDNERLFSSEERHITGRWLSEGGRADNGHTHTKIKNTTSIGELELTVIWRGVLMAHHTERAHSNVNARMFPVCYISESPIGGPKCRVPACSSHSAAQTPGRERERE